MRCLGYLYQPLIRFLNSHFVMFNPTTQGPERNFRMVLYVSKCGIILGLTPFCLCTCAHVFVYQCSFVLQPFTYRNNHYLNSLVIPQNLHSYIRTFHLEETLLQVGDPPSICSTLYPLLFPLVGCLGWTSVSVRGHPMKHKCIVHS